MYCSKCGRNYPKNKKVCSDCGTALVPGTSPRSRQKKTNWKLIIISSTVFVVVVAFFLIVGLMGRVPAKVRGTWYGSTGMGGIFKFQPDSVVDYTVNSTYEGTYSFNSETEEGTMILTINDQTNEYEFTSNGETLEMGGLSYTKQYVEQTGGFSIENLKQQLEDTLD